MDVKARVPWQAKIAAKLVLSRLPARYALWRRLSLFKHGRMERPEYAVDTFRQQFEAAGLGDRQPLVVMEMGPGDSLFSALIARAWGASEVWLMDVGRFAEDDLAAYRAMARHLEALGRPVPGLRLDGTLGDMLASIGARYDTDGLAGLRRVPAASVDLIWSNAVLEHVRAGEFADTAREMHRVLKPDGLARHRIDLRDHLSGALNNLRFTAPVWESATMARSGFYTNRLRRDEILSIFRAAGFEVEVTREVRWPALPTPRRKLNARWRDRPDEELLVSGFDVTLKKRA